MESMFRAIQLVRDRQDEIVKALGEAGIPFTLSGSNATFVWIASVDESATRQYRNVEFVIGRNDLERVISVLSCLGMIAEAQSDHILFRNETIRHDRWADIALFAGESVGLIDSKVPNLNATELIDGLPVIGFDRLVSFQLSRWLLDDQVDLRDLIGVGLLDDRWIDRFPPLLSDRLKGLLDNPDG